MSTTRDIALVGLLSGLVAACASAPAPEAKAADKGTVVVIGATGPTGRPLVGQLLEQGYRVRAFVRDADKARNELPSGIDVVVGDATRPETLAGAIRAGDRVAVAIGAPCWPGRPFPAGATPEDVEYRGVVNAARSAKAAGARQFVLVSAVGAGDANPDRPTNRMCDMSLKWKGDSERDLRALGIPYTILRPSGLLPPPGQPDCKPGTVGLRLRPVAEEAQVTGPTSMICRADLGRTMVDALGNPAALGKTVVVQSDPAAGLDEWRSHWDRIAAD